MDSRISSINIVTDDEYLKSLIEESIKNFYASDGNKKMDGLRYLVDAFDRTKTIDGNNKKISIEKILNKITEDNSLRDFLNDYFKNMTKISNIYNIRHHEKDKLILKDEKVIDFLYYSYFNIRNLIFCSNTQVYRLH